MDPNYIGARRRRVSGTWRWISEIRVLNKHRRVWLGTFDSAEMAALAHDSAELSLNGRTSRLNFPELAGRLPLAESQSNEDVKLAASQAADLAFHVPPPPQPQAPAPAPALVANHPDPPRSPRSPPAPAVVTNPPRSPRSPPAPPLVVDQPGSPTMLMMEELGAITSLPSI